MNHSQLIEESSSHGPLAPGLEAVWTGYFQRLTRFADGRLSARTRSQLDAEDVAASTMRSFCRTAPKRNPEDGSPWALLKTIATRKISKAARRMGAQKRRGEAAASLDAGSDEDFDFADSAAPSPSEQTLQREAVAELLALLPSEELRQIARLRGEGLEVSEIAAVTERGVRTIERRLDLIRRLWSHEAAA